MKKLFGFITGDLWRKLAALFFAVIIYWNVNEFQKDEKKIFNIPVGVHLTHDLIMTSPQRFTAAVRVRGGASILKDMDSRSISGRVEVSSKNRQPDGSYRVRLTPANFRTPRNVKVTAVDSDKELTLYLQRRISRELPVVMRFSGELSNQYRLSDRVCIPRRVAVSGPESAVSELKDVATEPIPLSDRESGFEYEVKLAPPDRIEVTPGKVTVQIGIERNVVQRDMSAVPVGLFCDSGLETVAKFPAETPPRAAVSLVGPATLVSGVKPDDLRLYVDVSNVSTPGVYTLPVKCHVRRAGVDVRSVIPAEFKISISKAPIKK